MNLKTQFRKFGFLPLLASLVFFVQLEGNAQQVLWAKLYPLPEEDQITCIAQDKVGDMYAGGFTRKGNLFWCLCPKAMIYKLNSEGDTLFSKWTDIYGEVNAIAVDYEGNIRIAVTNGKLISGATELHLLTMTPNGFIFKRDTIPNIIFVNHSCIGKDSSWILVGGKPNLVNAFYRDFYIQRIRKDGTIEPFITLNDNFSGQARRVEQLPDGKYLVSGSAGTKIISYTFDENLTNPQPMETWYQASGTNSISVGSAGQAFQKGYVLGGQSSPCFVSVLDSLRNKMWLKKDTGVIILPQAMTDGSILSGYSQRPVNPTHLFTRRAADSSTVWFLNLRDSLAARGMQGNLILKAYTFFQDESAVVAATLQRGTVVPYTAEDPIFIKISNVGTPVSVLEKPKRGPLQNETLAPWPNPTGGRLYLKQHFDKAEVYFYNLSGKEVGQYQIRFGQPIDVGGMEKGLYLYRARIDGKAYSGKILRQ